MCGVNCRFRLDLSLAWNTKTFVYVPEFMQPLTCGCGILLFGVTSQLLICCAVLVIGGGEKIRDLAPAAFLLGHSIRHWLLKLSTMPVYMTREGHLTVPVSQRIPEGPVADFVQSMQPRLSMQPRGVSAAA